MFLVIVCTGSTAAFLGCEKDIIWQQWSEKTASFKLNSEPHGVETVYTNVGLIWGALTVEAQSWKAVIEYLTQKEN